MSCDLRMFVEEAAKPIASQDAGAAVNRRAGPAVGWVPVEGALGLVGVVVTGAGSNASSLRTSSVTR
jgi:hypothetical protein